MAVLGGGTDGHRRTPKISTWSLRRRASGARVASPCASTRQSAPRRPRPHVDEPGEATVSEPTMYQLAHWHGASAQRTFEITFSDPGGRAYVSPSVDQPWSARLPGARADQGLSQVRRADDTAHV